MIIQAQANLQIPCRFEEATFPEIILCEDDAQVVVLEIDTDYPEFRTTFTSPCTDWTLSAETVNSTEKVTRDWTTAGRDIYRDWSESDREFPFNPEVSYPTPVLATNGGTTAKKRKVTIKIRPPGDLPPPFAEPNPDKITIFQRQVLDLELDEHERDIHLFERDPGEITVRYKADMNSFPATLRAPAGADTKVETISADGTTTEWTWNANKRRWQTNLAIGDCRIRTGDAEGEVIAPIRFEATRGP